MITDFNYSSSHTSYDDSQPNIRPHDCKVILSAKGKPLLEFDKHIFHKNSVVGSKIYWRCAHSKRLNCRARIITNKSNFLDLLCVKKTVHCHEPIRRLQYGFGVEVKRINYLA